MPAGPADGAGRRQAALDLLARYVRVVDDPRRIEEWPDLFSEEATYLVVTRENHERGLPIAVVRDDTKDRIRDRVVIIREFWGAGGRTEDRHYNEAWPRHIVGPAWVELEESGEAHLGANFMVWGSGAIDGQMRVLAVGEYRDVVVFSDGAARFKAKTVILDHPVLQDVFVYPL
ncbi:MAG: nuclear transport factor 2 family protein [Armatimonadota bacterium]|nr:nuclear transport factor 2 family protein [Armatimonadota bacterium]MDR7520353.1 nuclear transport factor 2 family protein [Armatimonadota bacterium]